MAINVEDIIKEAEARGVFDNLPGKGKPLPEDEFKDLPEELRMTYRVLKGAGYVPNEVHLKKSLEELRLKVKEQTDPIEIAKILDQLNKIEAELNLKIEKIQSLSKL